MWCGVKFNSTHSCLKSQLYHMLVDCNDDKEEADDLFLDCEEPSEEGVVVQKEEDSPVISLHALFGTTGYNTMRMQGQIRNQLVNILIDSGSTHNFVDPKVIKNAGIKLQPVNSFTVTVANGDKLRVQQCCSGLCWEAQGLQQSIDFFVLSLRGCDVVLGIQWLISLGPILWNFKALTMQFQWGGQTIIWKGQVDGQVLLMSRKQAAKVHGSHDKGPYTMLLTGCTHRTIHTIQVVDEAKGTLPLDLQQLLDCYAFIFEVPTHLPPHRSHDHRIPLLDETKAVKIRPYRYPSVQKNELEKLVAEMLETGLLETALVHLLLLWSWSKRKMGLGDFVWIIDS